MGKSEKMKAICEECVGCKACAEACPQNAITIVDNGLSIIAQIDTDKCLDCNLCIRICQNRNSIDLLKPTKWLQGWADHQKRSLSSSGGVAYELIDCFIKNGGNVYTCIYEDGDFIYKKVNNREDIKQFIGSKYVKSNPVGVYNSILSDLNNGNKVLFIGLPCHVQAVKMYMNRFSTHVGKLYTVDLICHGTPSGKLFKQYLEEERVDLTSINNISFRNKSNFSLTIDTAPVSSNKYFDYWIRPFLGGLTYTDNCYTCRFGQFNRCSDMTIGDSWGSELDLCERHKGISLILVMTDKGRQLIENCNLHLESVDIEKARRANPQLNHPTKKPKDRSKFERHLYKGYKHAVYSVYKVIIMKGYFYNTAVGRAYHSLRLHSKRNK